MNASWRVLWRTARGTSVEQFTTYPEARKAFTACSTIPNAAGLTLWELVRGEWFLADMFPPPINNFPITPRTPP